MTGARIALGVAALVLGTTGAPAPRIVAFVSSPAGAGAAPGGRVPSGSRICVASLDGTGGTRVLTEGFAAAASPRASFDATEVLFAGRREEKDRDAIFAARADGSGVRRAAGMEGADCGSPALLPDGRILFTAAGAIHTVAADGTGIQRITFHADGADLDPVVLADGRVLFVRGSTLLAVHNDGTGVHPFHGPGLPPAGLRRPREDEGRTVWVVGGGRVLRIDARRPERPAADGAPGLEGEVRSVEPLPGGGLLVSVRAGGSLGLRLLGPGGGPRADDPGRDETDPVLLAPTPRPRGHLSVVKPGTGRGRIYCIDARRTARGAEPPLPSRIRIYEALPAGERLLGEGPLSADGSFYAEVPADRPLRAETLDAAGAAVRRSGFSFWVRPNEVRACIGCHEDPAVAPPNALPAAVQGEPLDLVAR